MLPTVQFNTLEVFFGRKKRTNFVFRVVCQHQVIDCPIALEATWPRYLAAWLPIVLGTLVKSMKMLSCIFRNFCCFCFGLLFRCLREVLSATHLKPWKSSFPTFDVSNRQKELLSLKMTEKALSVSLRLGTPFAIQIQIV